MWKGLVFIAAGIVVALGAGCVKAGPPMSMQGFQEAYIAEVRRQLPDATIAAVSDDHLEIADGKGHEIYAYLDIDYGAYRQDPTGLQDIVKRSVSASIEATKPREIAAATLLILVRPAHYVRERLFMVGHAGGPPPVLSRPIAGDLVEIVAVDQLSVYRFPSPSELRSTLRTDDAGVWAAARENLEDELANPDLTGKQVVELQSGIGLASSVLAESDLWDSPSMQTAGAPVVAPVGRDLLLVTHEGNAKDIAAMRNRSQEMRQDPQALSDRLFVRRKRAWVELAPPP